MLKKTDVKVLPKQLRTRNPMTDKRIAKILFRRRILRSRCQQRAMMMMKILLFEDFEIAE